jgi:CSLREA domain-containing protein
MSTAVRRHSLILLTAALYMIVSALLIVTPAHAASITVNTTLDEDVTNSACSLREAITAANTDAAYNGCSAGSGADTITFDGTVFATPQTIMLSVNLPTITTSLTIDGPDAARVTVTTNGVGGTRIFAVNASGGTVAFSDLTMTGAICTFGSCPGGGNGAGLWVVDGTVSVTNSTISSNRADQGAGIANSSSGTVTITNSIVSSNDALTAGGGGIFTSAGTMNIINSTIASNQATGLAGGIVVGSGAVLNVTASTIGSGNRAFSFGGAPVYAHGIYNNGGTVTVVNSTISGNVGSAGTPAGAIFSAGTLTITNSTISGNSSSTAGGIYVVSGTANVINSIISGNGSNVNGALAVNQNNVIGGTARLAALGNYGGSTQTMPPLPGSPAIDAGDNATCAAAPVNNADQRGITRPVNGTCDIGAVESRGFTMTITGGNNQSTSLSTAFANPLTVSVTSSFSEPVDGGAVTFDAPDSGASLSVTTAQLRTISGGAASLPATANGTAGTYAVPATASGTAGVSFTLTNTNTAPTADDDAITVNEDTSASVLVGGATSVLANDTDPESNALTAAVVTNPAQGTLTLNANGTFSYTPNANYYGADSFTYRANDGNTDSNTATVNITVTSVNDGSPVVAPATFPVVENSPTGTAVGTVSASDPADAPMNTALTYSITAGNTGNAFAINPTTGQITVAGTVDYESTPSYSLTVSVADSDPAGALSGTATITITVTDVDETAPTVTINQAVGQSDPTATLPITFDVQFSEVVTGFDNTDVSLAGSTANVSGASVNVSSGGTTYTVTVSGVSGTGTVVASILPGAAVDGDNNASLASTSSDNSVTYDTNAPTVTITRTDGDPSNASTVRFTLTFSGDVTGVDSDPSTQTDFAIITSGSLTGVSITSIVGSGSTYIVTVNTGTGTGTLALTLIDNDSITNTLNVPLGGTGAGNGDVTSPAYTIRPPQTAVTPVSTVAPLPPCALLGGGTNSIVRASVPGGLNADVFCRILVENSTYVQTPAEVGDSTLIAAGVLQAVDVFGFTSAGVQVTRFSQPITVCLQGGGRMFFRDATNAPRVTVPLATTSQNGYTCAVIPNAGTLVLVR